MQIINYIIEKFILRLINKGFQNLLKKIKLLSLLISP